ncbi:MAG: hypothetical protein ABS85_15605 [Sphingobacteriales bacterium SCN 48-20]|nr:MAG: hypothetical protein ABS85_15605 [Sphingobacteriales bacterium SCN 48-20]OJW43404.1 MAG: hypothetical protein BGO56_05620 [Sphingobacteriales bacterium 48-107]
MKNRIALEIQWNWYGFRRIGERQNSGQFSIRQQIRTSDEGALYKNLLISSQRWIKYNRFYN